MARKGSIFTRALQRATVSLARLSTERGRVITHLGNLAFTCPYCSKTLSSSAGRDHHITLRPACHVQHIRELNGYVSAHMKKKQQQARLTKTPAPNPLASSKQARSDCAGDEEGPSTKRLQHDKVGTAVRNPMQLPIVEPTINPHQTCNTHQNPNANVNSNQPTDPCCLSKSSSVDLFPISTAGAPISSAKRGPTLSRDDLRDYLASCGPMGDPEKFEVAELLMTMGLNGNNCTRWLKSNLVSGVMRKLIKWLTTIMIRQNKNDYGTTTGNYCKT